MVEIPKRGEWGGGSAVWEKFPNSPVIFFLMLPYATYSAQEKWQRGSKKVEALGKHPSTPNPILGMLY